MSITARSILARHLNIKSSEVTPLDWDCYGLPTFKAEGAEYAVATSDRKADKAAREYILNSLWAFNPSFIQSHSDLGDKAIKALARAQGELCEDSNDLVKGVIKDLPHFIRDAINADGRGHFLASYDSEESEEGNGYIYRIN